MKTSYSKARSPTTKDKRQHTSSRSDIQAFAALLAGEFFPFTDTYEDMMIHCRGKSSNSRRSVREEGRIGPRVGLKRSEVGESAIMSAR